MADRKTKQKRKYVRHLIVNRKITEDDNDFIISELKTLKPIYAIAESLKVSRQYLARYIHEHLEDVFKDVEEKRLDVAEFRMMQNIDHGDQGAIQYFLDRKGRSRGYGEFIQTENTNRGSAPVVIGDIKIDLENPNGGVVLTKDAPLVPDAPETPTAETAQ